MSVLSSTGALPLPPEVLTFGQVELRFVRVVPGEPERGFVPAYNFRVRTLAGADVGHINFRVGDTVHIRMYAGHIGYEIFEAHRGHGYARQACEAIAPFVGTIYQSVIITCDPDNLASKRTIENLGARFLEEVPVPPGEPQYRRGSRCKRRYEWTP